MEKFFYKIRNKFYLFSAFLLSGIFLTAGISKILIFNEFNTLLIQYELFPVGMIPFLVFLLIAIEITVGICLLIPSFRNTGAFFAMSLLVMFILLIAYVKFNNININCGCIAFIKRKMGLGLALQDSVLLLLAIYLYKKRESKDTEDKYV